MIFNKEPILGIDISDFSIKILGLGEREEIEFFNRIVIEEGIVKDGFIIKKEELVKVLKNALSRIEIEKGKVILSIPESKSFIHFFRVPDNLTGEELINVIESKVKKTIPLDPFKICWDYQLIPSSEKEDGKFVLFVATLKEIVDDYSEVLIKAGLEPLVFEMESLALGRALLGNLKQEKKVLIIDIGARTTNINVFDRKGILRDSTITPIAGNRFTKAISEKLEISEVKAEEIKRDFGLSEGKEKLKKILEKELNPLLEKVKRSISYCNNEVEKVYLVGGSAMMPKIADYFSLNLGIDVEIGISPIARRLKKKSLIFNVVIGLALRSLEKNPEKAGINFLSKKRNRKIIQEEGKVKIITKKEKKVSGAKKKVFTALAGLFLVIAFLFLFWVVYNSFLIEVKNNEDIEEFFIEEITPVDKKEEIIILETGTGWLDVRSGPGLEYEVFSRVYVGESYPLLAEFENWYKIGITDETEGWVSSRYANLK